MAESKKLMNRIPSFPMFVDTASLMEEKKDWTKTKIVCTIGPASRSVEMLDKLYNAGMRVARLNMSHGDHTYHAETVQNIRTLMAGSKHSLALMLDTKGPEIRTGKLTTLEVGLVEGQEFTLSCDETLIGDSTQVYQDYEELANTVTVGDKICVDDGLITLRVTNVNTSTLAVTCRVENDGSLGWNKGINLPGKKVKLPAVTPRDESDIIWGVQQGIDLIAASFIRSASDIREIRTLLGPAGKDIKIHAKIENQEGLDNYDEILAEADGIMVARGDMGIEIPIEKVFAAQKMMIAKCNLAGKPIVTATQMLESMIHNPRPTRAEVTDVASAVCDGSDCVMLSGESAKGKFPVECVQMMHRICREAEATLHHIELAENMRRGVRDLGRLTTSEAICSSAVFTANDINAKLIIVLTETGNTARLVSKYKPSIPIICLSPHVKVINNCQLSRGVYPKLIDGTQHIDTIFRTHVDHFLQKGYIQKKDHVVCVYGEREGVPGSTNVVKVLLA